jgi:hypothetical protein
MWEEVAMTTTLNTDRKAPRRLRLRASSVTLVVAALVALSIGIPSAATAKQITASSAAKNPCSLVTAKQIHVIEARKVTKVSEAPLGPTCIYSLKGTKAEVTIVIEASKFNKAIATLQSRKPRTILRHRGYCGQAGHPVLLVSLPNSKVLGISANCVAAVKIAKIVLRRL